MIHTITINQNSVYWHSDACEKCVQLEDQVTVVCVLSTKKHIAIAEKQSVFVYDEDGTVCSIIAIPNKFPDVICIQDMYYEENRFTLILAQHRGYDIACHFDPFTGQLLDWHFTK